MKNITVTAAVHPQQKDITVLSVRGFIDTNTAPEFEKTFQMALAERRFSLIVDLKETNYISSVGWGIFIGEIKRIRTQGGNLFLAGMSPEVGEAYQLLELGSIIKAFPDVDQAIQKGFGKAPGKKTTGKASAKAAAPQNVVQPRTAAAPVPAGATEPEPVATIPVQAAPAPAPQRKPGFITWLFTPWKWF